MVKRANAIILGVNSLLSKNPNLFLPNKWPTYFSKYSGCNLTDIDGKEYRDFSLLGVGTNILGYNNNYVDATLCCLEDTMPPTLECKDIKPSRQIINLLIKEYGVCNFKNYPKKNTQ